MKKNLRIFTARDNPLSQALVEYYGYKVIAVKPHSGRKPVYKYYAEPSFFERKIKLLERIDKDYPSLLFHHRIAAQTLEFVNFIKRLEILPEDPWVALDLYRRHLGKTTVYRALALTPQEAINIRENGMEPLRLNQVTKNTKIPLTYRVKLHVGGSGKKIGIDPELQSVTSYPEIARAVAEGFKKIGKNIYLFKIRIDELDLIKGNLKNPDSLVLFQGLDRYFQNRMVINYDDGKTKKIPYGPRVESLVLGRIAAEEILSYEETSSHNPGFSTEFEQRVPDFSSPNFR